jgi:L-threonylcarbamoyladenylate synthase
MRVSLVEVAKIYSASDENISLLARKLLGGELVAVPTETVYGLAANAYDSTACARIFHAKGRPAFDPLIVHLPLGFDLLQVAEPTALARTLIEAFWPGPLTIVLNKKAIIPGIVTSGLDSVALRMPRHPVFQRLLAACQTPLAAPSANPFGYVSPTTAQHVEESLGGRISHILDGGPCEIGLESTIIDVRQPMKPILLRPGAISREELSQVLEVWVADPSSSGGGEVMPGQLTKHYSPRSACRLRARIDLAEAVATPDVAYLFFQRPATLPGTAPPNLFWLSETGDEVEAAHRLFETLRRIDQLGFASLVAEPAPDNGLGIAINDRLRRAAAGAA